MKKLQLFALIALLGAVSYHNAAYTWPWSNEKQETYVIDTNQGNIGRQTVIYAGGPVTIRNGQIIVNGQITYGPNQTVIKDAGNPETKKVIISGVRNIDASGFGNLTIEQCASCPEILTIMTGENIMPHLKHEVSGKQLKLGFKDNIAIQGITPLNFHAVVKDINKISSTETMDIQSKNTIKTNTLDINQSGTGNINLSIDVDKVTVDHSGTGNTELSGTATEQKIDFSGTGNYKTYNLRSQNTSVNLSGVGTAYINALKNLSYRLSGIGTIYYKGNPKINGSKSGLGKIKKA